MIIESTFSFSSFIANAATTIHSQFTTSITNFKYIEISKTVNRTKSAYYPDVLVHRYNSWTGIGNIYQKKHTTSDTNPSSKTYYVKSTRNYLSDSYSIPSVATIENGIYAILNKTKTTIDSLPKETNSLYEITKAILEWIDNHTYILTSVLYGRAVCYKDGSDSKVDADYSRVVDIARAANVKDLLLLISQYALQNSRYEAITYSIYWA